MDLIIIGLLIIILLMLWLNNKKLEDVSVRLIQDMKNYKEELWSQQLRDSSSVEVSLSAMGKKVDDLWAQAGLDVEVELDKFKINDSENGVMSADVLQINGGSYVDDMPDYEWFFSLAREDFPALYRALTGQTEIPDDVAVGLKQYLQEHGTTVTELKEICTANDIEHSFSNYM